MADIKTVIKTLDHCIRSQDCLKCEYLGKCKYLDKDVLELLKEQQAEIKRLKAEQPIKGHWTGDEYGYTCSICGKSMADATNCIDYVFFKMTDYCPFCGADMREKVINSPGIIKAMQEKAQKDGEQE